MSDVYNIKESILELLKDNSLYTIEEIVHLIQKNDDSYITEDIIDAISILEKDNLIYRSKKKRYGLLSSFNLHIGRIELKKQGYGFFKFDDSNEEDAYVAHDDLENALNNDTVICFVNPISIEGQKREARVVKVIKHNDDLICHVIHKFHSLENKKLICDTYPYVNIIVDDFMTAIIDDVVLLEVTSVDLVNKQVIKGKIRKIIGNKNAIGVDIKSIAYKYNLNDEFSDDLNNELIELNNFYLKEKENELKKRIRINRDIITIDGSDALDFDDAVSVKKLENGNYFLGVYIADVSYFVRENSIIDKEAFERGTSVYLLDKVIPMLPFKLSNDLCSLNEHEDKYVLALEMEIDSEGLVIQSSINEAVIQSKHRMTYSLVNEILENINNEDCLSEEFNAYSDVFEMIKEMNELREILNRMRFKRGSLNFEIPEAKIVLDDLGHVSDIKLRERFEAEKMIEEFMLIANETVASLINSMELPFIYRVHDLPNSLKLDKFKRIIKNTKYYIKTRGKSISQRTLQSLLNEISLEDSAISTMILRMMAKAKYDTVNIGHYGLASKCYTHFTSPIRRYPDLIVHRLIRKYIIDNSDFYNNYTKENEIELLNKLQLIANQSSEREVNASDCEYEVRDMKIAEYMENHIGEKFKGRISSVTNFGMFVCIKDVIEGLVHIRDIEGDYYIYDDIKMALVGRSTKNVYRMGDSIEVICVNASKDTCEIDFKIVNKNNSASRKKDNSVIKYSRRSNKGVKHDKKRGHKSHR